MMTAAKTSDKTHENGPNEDSGETDEKGKENEKNADEFCFECKSSLAKSPELINITGQSRRRWHPECFKCMACREPMDKRQSCHVYKDQIFCRSDYMRLKRDQSIKCKRCHWPIGASDWVRKAADYVYHLACFNCDICFRQLNTGEQFVINSQPPPTESEGGTSVDCMDPKTVRLMCKLHFTVENGKQQQQQQHGESGVTEPETENGELSPDFRNSSPGSMKPDKAESSIIKLQSKQRSQRDHQALKSDHFHLLTSSPSASCSSSIIRPPDHHLQHHHQQQQQHQFPATQASQSNKPPEQQPQPPLQMTSQHLMSKDYSLMVSSPTSSSLMLEDNFMNRHHRVPSSGSTTSSSTPASSSSTSTNLGCTSGRLTPTGGCSGSGTLQSKSKRVRTTFTEDQLSILQTHFQIDSNPDGQDLERIATITGLSKRVTQVWFQNSRARQKKYMIKRKPAHSSATSMVSMNHVHHHQRQHAAVANHQGVALMNQSMNNPDDISPPSNLELSSSPVDRSSGLDPHRLQAAFEMNFSHQFREASFGSGGATSELRPVSDGGEKEDEESNQELHLDQHDEQESSDLASESEPDGRQLKTPNARDDDLAQSNRSTADRANCASPESLLRL